jgi:hypothetical protein
MSEYRPSRNIEASITDFLKTNFDADWTGVNVEKTFARIYDSTLPSVCVRVSDTTHNKVEVGSNATWRFPLILIDIFARSDGQRLDMKDYIIEKIKSGLPYYKYTIVNGAIDSKVIDGRIRITNIADTPIDFGIDKDKLPEHDRYRHLLSLTVSLGRIES